MRKMMWTGIGWFMCFAAHAQTPAKTLRPMDYGTYMEQVWKQHPGYAAEKLKVSVAEAGAQVARVFNDPQLSVEYADNDERRLQMGRSVSVELGKTFSFGKRNARIDLAESEKELNESLLEDYFHRLRAGATLAWFEALKQAALHAVRENSCENIRRLAEADSIRFALGKITDVDALQSRLEAEKASAGLLQSHAEQLNACEALSVWTGVFDPHILPNPAGALHPQVRAYDTDALLQTALENRADLAAALKNVEVARKALQVVRRERNTDVDLAIGYNYNTEVRNEIAPAPAFNGLTLGIAVPLKFSNANKGALRAAELRRQQAELDYRQAELEIQTAVMQSLRTYFAQLEQVRRFETGMLDRAGAILQGKLYSYERGETSRLEALVAQQTYDDLHTAYIETVFNSLAALIELERNAGIWDFAIE
ncbi:MAG: TolC family protein [Tannerella sp.]|jgi:cobalt-zinc-cadmium efflux system outer membrane protein|nr:TolC family protein [Tannerella sp.]